MSYKCKVIIPASGKGERFGGKTPKQFVKIDGIEILSMTLRVFQESKLTDEIIIASRKEYIRKINGIVKKNNFYKVNSVVEGGETRQESVRNALLSVSCNDDDIILVHDAVRPFVSKNLIKKLIYTAGEYGSAIPAIKITDTVKDTDKDGFIIRTVPRDFLYTVQTPQAFKYKVLSDAFKKAEKEKFIGTDEASVAEYAGYKVKIIDGEKGNIKITKREDIIK